MKSLVTMLFILAAMTSPADSQNWVDFSVTRHVNTLFTTATFDNAMTDVNLRMQLDNHDCPDDVPCTARFRRIGLVGIFGTLTDGLDVITTDAELNAVFGLTTHRIKIVTAISCCDGQINPSIIGCGTCNGFGFIVENWVQGNVYVHEYGHNVMGCDHRDDCDWNIMNSGSTGLNNSVNDAECTGFGGNVYQKLCGDVYDGNGGPLTVARGPYWITCDVMVPANQTLTIEPGVEIQFNPGLRITSNGTANADGTASTITIYSNNESRNLPTAIVNSRLEIRNGGVLILE